MYFYLSKIFGILIDPGWIFLLLAGWAFVLSWRGWKKTARLFGWFAALWFAALSLTPLPHWAVRSLERQSTPLAPCFNLQAYALPGPPKSSEPQDRVECLPERVAGVISLGGATRQAETVRFAQPQTNEGGERLSEFVHLGRLYPDARMIFTGGSGRLWTESITEDQVTWHWLARVGFPIERVEFDAAARNTRENAANARAMANPQPGETWLLVTSAFHMPRARILFEEEGFAITPYPVDFLVADDAPFFRPPGVAAGFSLMRIALREWAAIAVEKIR